MHTALLPPPWAVEKIVRSLLCLSTATSSLFAFTARNGTDYPCLCGKDNGSNDSCLVGVAVVQVSTHERKEEKGRKEGSTQARTKPRDADATLTMVTHRRCWMVFVLAASPFAAASTTTTPLLSETMRLTAALSYLSLLPTADSMPDAVASSSSIKWRNILDGTSFLASFAFRDSPDDNQENMSALIDNDMTTKETTTNTTPSQRHLGLQLIGSGFSRTGTKSTKAALEQLGHKVYDTASMLQHNHVDGWVQAANDMSHSRNNNTALLQMTKMLENNGYTATLDYPMNMFAIELAKIRPNARVLSTVRNNAQEWFESFRFICELFQPLSARPWRWLLPVDWSFPLRIAEAMGGLKVPYGPIHSIQPLPWYEEHVTMAVVHTRAGQDAWMELYNQFNARVVQEVPSHQLFVFRVEDGWVPLLRFLRIDDPDLEVSAFPHVNDRKSLETVRMILKVVGVGFPFWISLLVVWNSWILLSICRWLTKVRLTR